MANECSGGDDVIKVVGFYGCFSYCDHFYGALGYLILFIDIDQFKPLPTTQKDSSEPSHWKMFCRSGQ